MSADLSFESDIKPLFRDKDHEAMQSHFDLRDLEDVRENSEAILSELEGGGMPCDGAWPAERIAVFQSWVDAGMPD